MTFNDYLLYPNIDLLAVYLNMDLTWKGFFILLETQTHTFITYLRTSILFDCFFFIKLDPLVFDYIYTHLFTPHCPQSSSPPYSRRHLSLKVSIVNFLSNLLSKPRDKDRKL